MEDVFASAVACARAAGARYVAGDIGPIGALLRPLGTMSFDEAYLLFKEEVEAGVKAGVDLFIIETMTDLAETKAAVLAAKENSDLPIFATMTFRVIESLGLRVPRPCRRGCRTAMPRRG